MMDMDIQRQEKAQGSHKKGSQNEGTYDESTSSESKINGPAHKSPRIISLSAFRQLRIKDDNLLTQALKGVERAAIFTVRINRYQMLLETFAGCSGDQIGRQVEKQLLVSLRESDFAVHISPDEFVVMVNDVAVPPDVEDIAIRLINACSYLESHEGNRVPVSIDIGIASFPADSRNAKDLLRCAHIALHTLDSARHGNYQFFIEDQRASHHLGMTMTGELIQAMQDDRMELLYQPIYCMNTDRIVGLEALVRLRSVAGELLMPEDFIDVAERSGLIVPLGMWVMKQACLQLAQWHKAGAREVRMSINVSPVQLEDPGFSGALIEAITGANIGYESIEIEIVERQQISTNVTIVLANLRRLGIRVAVDDFGTGYSSLANLARYPLDVVKIDQSFIKTMLDSAVAKSIVSAIFAIATELDLGVIAEGVETIDQEEYLRGLGCKTAQGFGYARPMSAESLSLLFDASQGSVYRSCLRAS
jgi:diguanylate cyclase (GGDEF)-like protein